MLFLVVALALCNLSVAAPTVAKQIPQPLPQSAMVARAAAVSEQLPVAAKHMNKQANIVKVSTSSHSAAVVKHATIATKQPPKLPQWAKQLQHDLSAFTGKKNGSKPVVKLNASKHTTFLSNATTIAQHQKETEVKKLAGSDHDLKAVKHLASANVERNKTVVTVVPAAVVEHVAAQKGSTKQKMPVITKPKTGPVALHTSKDVKPALPAEARQEAAVQPAKAVAIPAVNLKAEPVSESAKPETEKPTSKASKVEASSEKEEIKPASKAEAKEPSKAASKAQPCASTTKAPSKPRGAQKFEVPFKSASRFMNKMADTCQCEFKNTCSCVAAMEFMDCVAHACASGRCDCKEMQYEDACSSMAGTCQSLDFECSKDKAVCLSELESDLEAEAPEVKKTPEEVIEELRDLKEKKCRLDLAAEDGWLNAQKQLEETNGEIEARLADLVERGDRLPEMHCEKHFEEWHELEPQLADGGDAEKSSAFGLLTWVPLSPLVFFGALSL